MSGIAQSTFGLEDNLADLDDKGYTVLHDAFTPELADELRAEAHRNHDAAPPDTGFRATMLLRRGRLWEYAATHPLVLTLAEYLLGRGCVMYQSDTIIKGPGLDTHPGLHADYGASRVGGAVPGILPGGHSGLGHRRLRPGGRTHA